MADRRDFQRIAMPHLDAVYRTAVALAGDGPAADDLAQATFVKALERFKTFREGTNARAWLLTICRNTRIDQIRHKKVAGQELPLDESQLPAGEFEEVPADLLERFSDEQIVAALLELPAEQRMAILLVDVERLSHAEAAEVLEVATGTVKSRASRGRARLRAKLAAHAKDLGIPGREPWRT